jgi:hypothetical protein
MTLERQRTFFRSQFDVDHFHHIVSNKFQEEKFKTNVVFTVYDYFITWCIANCDASIDFLQISHGNCVLFSCLSKYEEYVSYKNEKHFFFINIYCGFSRGEWVLLWDSYGDESIWELRLGDDERNESESVLK